MLLSVRGVMHQRRLTCVRSVVKW